MPDRSGHAVRCHPPVASGEVKLALKREGGSLRYSATLRDNNNREETTTAQGPAAEEDLQRLSQWGCSVLVKSVDEGRYLVDYLYDRTTGTLTPHPKKKLLLDDRNGTGDTLASAIATHLAAGESLPVAVTRAEAYMSYFLAGPRYYISVAK